jgi:hypothetical protein
MDKYRNSVPEIKVLVLICKEEYLFYGLCQTMWWRCQSVTYEVLNIKGNVMLATLLAVKKQHVKCKRVSLYSSDDDRYSQLMYGSKPKNQQVVHLKLIRSNIYKFILIPLFQMCRHLSLQYINWVVLAISRACIKICDRPHEGWYKKTAHKECTTYMYGMTQMMTEKAFCRFLPFGWLPGVLL